MCLGSRYSPKHQGERKKPEILIVLVAGCLDRAIVQTSAGETIDSSLATIVDGVLRSSSGENGKLVHNPSFPYLSLFLTVPGDGPRAVTSPTRSHRDDLPILPSWRIFLVHLSVKSTST